MAFVAWASIPRIRHVTGGSYFLERIKDPISIIQPYQPFSNILRQRLETQQGPFHLRVDHDHSFMTSKPACAYASGTHGRTGKEAHMMDVMDKAIMSYDILPDSVLYDIFYESGTRLGGEYVYRMRNTGDPFERSRWQRALVGLDTERAAVKSDDRQAQIEAKERWDAERSALEADGGRERS